MIKAHKTASTTSNKGANQRVCTGFISRSSPRRPIDPMSPPIPRISKAEEMVRAMMGDLVEVGVP